MRSAHFTGTLVCLALALTTAIKADEYLGVPVGKLSNPQASIQGSVYLANATVIYIHDFSIKQQSEEEEIFFVLSTKEDIIPIRRVYKHTFDPSTGESAILRVRFRRPNFNYDVNKVGLYAFLPNQERIDTYTTFGIFASKSWKYLASVRLNQNIPEPYCCLINANDPSSGIIGHHYDAHTGPIKILDSKTIEFSSFTLDGTKAPDAWIFTGNGSTEPVTRHSGRKAMVIGRDTPRKQCSLKDHYTGESSLMARLLHGQDIYNIRFISIFCYQYDVDFGHIDVNLNPAIRPVPLFVPPPVNDPHDTTAQHAQC